MLTDYIELIGMAGSLVLSLCGIPQAYISIKLKNSDGLTLYFVVLWLIGEILMLSYVLIKYIHDIPLMINYIISGISVIIISYYKFWPKR